MSLDCPGWWLAPSALSVGVVADHVTTVMVFPSRASHTGWTAVGTIGVIGVAVGVHTVDTIDGDECVWYPGPTSVRPGPGTAVGFASGGSTGGPLFYVLPPVVVVPNGSNPSMGRPSPLELYKGECWLPCWEVSNLSVLPWRVWGTIAAVVSTVAPPTT